MESLTEFFWGLFASHYFSALHQGVIYLHVIGALLALVVAPGAMIVRKTGPNHKRWGRVYFWSMVATNLSAFWLLTWRFNTFLFGVTILSLYGVLTGYRAMHRKSQQVTGYDRAITAAALVTGLGQIAWAGVAASGMVEAWIPSGGGSVVPIVLPLIFGIAVVALAGADLKLYRTPSPDRRWWWYYHMDRMLGSYIALLSALMVQQVGPRLPDSIAWIAWVAPTIVGAPLIAFWIMHYRRKFGARGQAAQVPGRVTPSLS